MGLDQHVHPQPIGGAHHLGGLRVLQHRKHHQHRIGAVQPRLCHLPGIDDEILGEDRPVEHAPHRRQVLERAAEERPVGQHADRGGGAGIGFGLDGRIDLRDLARRRRGLLDLHDETRAGGGERGGKASLGPLRLAADVAEGGAAEPLRNVDLLARDDRAQRAAGLTHG